MDGNLSLHLQNVWQSSKIGFYCLKAAASAEFVEIFFGGLRGWCCVVLMGGRVAEMQRGLAKTLANPLQERKRQDSNLRTALGRSTVFEAASFSHSDTLPIILLGLCPKPSQSPRPPFKGGDQGLRAFHRRWTFPARQLRPGI